jgi:hypothetical protein
MFVLKFPGRSFHQQSYPGSGAPYTATLQPKPQLQLG